MRKILFVCLTVLFLAKVAYADVGENFAHELTSSLVEQKGKVIGVEKNTVVLDKGSNDGIMKGELVYIYKNLGVFVDPTTQKRIDLKSGRCYAQVESVEPTKSTAKIIRGTKKIQKYFLGLPIITNGYTYSKPDVSDNDEWIIGKSLYRVAIVTRNPVLFDSIRNALESTKKFEVVDPDTIEIAMTKEKITSISTPEDIEKLCSDVNCDFVIPVYLKNNNQISYNIYNGYSGDLIYSTSSKISQQEMEKLKTTKLAENLPPENAVPSTLNIEPRLTLWESLLNKFGLYSKYSNLGASSATMRLVNYANIGYQAKALAATGDLIIVANKGQLELYRFDGYSLNKVASANVGYNIFNIDTAQIDGKTYLAISSFNPYGQLSSSIAYIEGSSIHIIKDSIGYCLRFFDIYSKPQLIAQNMSIGSRFYGPIYEMNLNGTITKELKLPIDPESFYEFEQIGDKLVYATPNNEIAIYDIANKKNFLTGQYISGSVEPIQRYSHSYNPNENYFENKNKGVVYIQNVLKFFKHQDNYYVLVPKSYRSNAVQVAGSHYNAYSISMYKLDNNKLQDVWNSGSVSGRVVNFARQNDYIVGLIATPAPFFTRFILGENDIYRLTIFEINK
ncbi:hypothetical protein DESAMIL20_2068 [Desulfurella amilsii]|uniref:Uncharacterized protein n=1 Tax=Desulfurella amilsii TaxID=1562698 RepID=A0A1X4XUC3_9BACT|nr:hypothetical protein [Desulfurella amilsii]OSS41130.1 hypothetical protein DESAMIL20_2068 [Desulfurella amilsii]